MFKSYRVATLVVTALALAGAFVAAAAAPPPAGTNIGNQASATYVDNNGATQTVTSNLVTTVVTQIAGVVVDPDQAKVASPGGQVSYALTLTNNGNGSDSFNLSYIQSGGFSLTAVTFYNDADGNGVPDSFTPITFTPSLAAGAIFQFVAVGNVPGAALAGSTNTLTVTGTSVLDGGVSDDAVLTTTVSGQAVLDVTKSIAPGSGNPGTGPYSVTLTYTNTGNDTATAFTIDDLLPAGMSYVPGSGRWSVTGATVLTDSDSTDAQGTAPNTIVYDYGVRTSGTMTAIIGRVTPGQSGTLTFSVSIDAGQVPGTINNTAEYSYDDGSTIQGPFNTNTFPFVVNQIASVTVDADTVASTTQGSSFTFNNVVTNLGNGTDRFNITMSGSTFPAGTAFTLYQSNGVTPLLDTGVDGIPDTGPLAPGASYTVVVRVNLPGAATGGPYQVNKTATSVFNGSVTDTDTDVLTTIVAGVVDLTNNAAGPGAPGAGQGPEASPVTTNSVNPGSPTVFTLYVNNLSLIADSYDLSASTDSTFGSITLPAGWSVVFRNLFGTVVTNSGAISAGANRQITATVTVPAGSAAVPSPGQSIFFRALSPTSGSSDRKHDAVIVNTIRSIALNPNNTGQVFPGGTTVYAHVLSNNGNITENDGVLSTISLGTGNSNAPWSSEVYRDNNGNGALDPSDSLITSPSQIGSIAPGAQVNLLVKVTAPAGAAIGSTNTTTLTATPAGSVNGVAAPAAAAATDFTTVVGGNVTVLKEQALDADCDGVADGAFTTSALNAPPGACIQYRITVTNIGSADADSVQVSDAVPANTTYFYNGAPDQATTSVGSISSVPANGGTGTIVAVIGLLNPSAGAVVTFGVKIDQ